MRSSYMTYATYLLFALSLASAPIGSALSADALSENAAADATIVLAMGEKPEESQDLVPPPPPEDNQSLGRAALKPVIDLPEVEEELHNHGEEMMNSVPPEEVLKVRARAEAGDAAAQAELAEMFHDGAGVAHDWQSALRWFKKAANNGSERAMYFLGRYYRGEFPMANVEKDYDEAEKWLLIPASRGDALSMAELGTLLFERARNGEPERREEANYWYNRATGGPWDENYEPPSLRLLKAKTEAQEEVQVGAEAEGEEE